MAGLSDHMNALLNPEVWNVADVLFLDISSGNLLDRVDLHLVSLK